MDKAQFSGIEACVFDAYGTLFDLGDIARTFGTRLGDKAEAFAALWRRKQLEYTWLRTLIGRHVDFWHVTGESLDHTMAALGFDDPLVRTRLMEWWLKPKAYGEAAEVLGALQRAGFRTAILSNGSPTLLTSGVGSSGLGPHLDAVLSVEAAGAYKPHPSVYRIATDRFGLEPRQVCFVSGNYWDAAGAAAFGFKVAWVNRAGAVPDRLPAGPDAEISDLGGLRALLGAT